MNVFGNYLLPRDADTLFDDAALCRAMLAFESALATAQVEEGVIPTVAGEAIASACAILQLDPTELVEAGRHSGAMGIPLVAAIGRALQPTAPEAVRHVHQGATTQDVVDTAQVLMTRHACERLLAELDACIERLLTLAREHVRTPMLARTLMQPAQVTGFGLKCAQWAQPLQRSRAQLLALSKDAMVLQLGGAVGNRATLGEAGDRIAARMAAQLQLGCPESGWHTQRDAWMRLGLEVAVLAGSLSKIARDLSLLSQAEVGEVYAQDAQRGGSSAMPHKRNPVACMQAVAASIQVPHLAATLLSTMAQAHERALGEWQAEVAVWPQLWVQAFAATSAIRNALDGLHVDADRMARNIDQLQGVVHSESIAHALAPQLGKAQASALVRALGVQALQRQTPLIELLLADDSLAGLTTSQRDALRAGCSAQEAVAPSARLCEKLLQP
ncbi:MAG: lyase family protein [Polaromonas sp.]|nr:lyase family protein [Polaromonas sp.]